MVVGPGDEIAAGEEGRSRLRASHGDREQVIDTLKAAYVYGLVTKDEFDARVSQTFASRTCAELALATADIPAGLAAAQLPLEPAREVRLPGRPPAQRIALRAATGLRRRALQEAQHRRTGINKLKQFRAVANRYDKRCYTLNGAFSGSARVATVNTSPGRIL